MSLSKATSQIRSGLQLVWQNQGLGKLMTFRVMLLESKNFNFTIYIEPKDGDLPKHSY